VCYAGSKFSSDDNNVTLPLSKFIFLINTDFNIGIVTVCFQRPLPPTANALNGTFELYNVSSGGILLNPPQSTPWNYTGPFSVVSTLSPFFGNVSSISGRKFGALNGSTSISQILTNLQPGNTYFLSWLQRKKPNTTSSIGLNVYVDGKTVYNETVDSGYLMWNFKSTDNFKATGSNMTLTFSTTVSESPSSSVGIDYIIVNIYYMINDP
jgi:hypothetical protein